VSRAACAATTLRGASCRGIVPLGRTRCLVHDPELADRVAEARRRGGTTAMKLKLLAGKRQRLDTPRKLLAFVSDLALDTLSGSIEPDVSRATAYAVSLQMKLLETAEIERRLGELEERLAQQQPLRAAGRRR
jgi:uncharacterized coiled-coil protein SlyX